MKTIPLTRGLFAIVDDDAYPWLTRHRWHAQASGRYFYAMRTERFGPRSLNQKKRILMHRILLDGDIIDHVNRNTLDNRRENLRVADATQSVANTRIRSDNTSGFKGVAWDKQHSRWRAYICCKHKRFFLGLFSEILKAAQAYDAAARERFGEFANLNFPEINKQPKIKIIN